MSKNRNAEYKPLSFSTTMRNPARIADFLNCILPFEGKILTNEVIYQVAHSLIQRKIYQPSYILHTPRLKEILTSDSDFCDKDVTEIMDNSPQNHKEAGFDKGWPSRFDTWYKLPMEFGFVFYEINSPIVISATGHMLIDAHNEKPINDEKIKNVFLNSMAKYQTNNPFRKNANDNSPLLLLLQTIKLLKDDPNKETDAGISRGELSLVICWPNKNANALFHQIKKLRNKYGFSYSDEVIYDTCLKILRATKEQRNRFKISQITGEAVDEFIRKMRITGVISLRGNGRFIDFNSFELEKIEYILKTYSNYKRYNTKAEFFKYIGAIDYNIISMTPNVDVTTVSNIKLATLNHWATEYSKEEIISELKIVCGKKESSNKILRVIDKPTRFEFLTSIALKQNFAGLTVSPNYHVDDEGLPTFTASGGVADIECVDTDCNSFVEVTLMRSRDQSICEIPAITRHLQEAIEKNPNIMFFSILVAPSIHSDTKYMIGFSKFQYNIDILAFNLDEFVKKIVEKNRISETLLN